MKQKKENSELEVHADFTAAVLAYDESTVKAYLDKNEFKLSLDDVDAEIYRYTRETLGKSLDTKSVNNPIFAVLIERIARLSILLDKFEKLLFVVGGLSKEEMSKYTERGSSYNALLEQHRKCIETFCNLRSAVETGKPKKTLAKLREVVFEEKEGS